MENKHYIHEELMEVSPAIAGIEKNKIYSLSESYFTDLSSHILEKIRSGVEPVYSFSKVTPFQVPPRFFDQFPTYLMEKISYEENKKEVFDETESISPLLNKISKTSVFEVPEGYFSKENNFSSLGFRAEPKVFTIKRRSSFYKYISVAAVLILLIAGNFLFTGKPRFATQAGQEAAKAQVNKLKKEDIIEFFKTNASFSGDAATTLNKSSARESYIKNSVSKMSDQEIKDFLKENGETDEI